MRTGGSERLRASLWKGDQSPPGRRLRVRPAAAPVDPGHGYRTGAPPVPERTEIDGQSVHFVRVRCGDNDAVPLILTQQMPSSRGRGPELGGLDGFSPVEQRPAVQPLADADGLADCRRGGFVLVRAQQAGGVVEQPVG